MRGVDAADDTQAAQPRELWFSLAEYRRRLVRAQTEIYGAGLDGLLAFQAESVTWLTGYFTRAYGAFQLAVVPPSGDPTVVCRDRSAFYVDFRGAYGAREAWIDGQDPVEVAARAIRAQLGERGRLGIEMGAWHLNAARMRALEEALPSVEFVDVGHMLARLRLIKSPAEIAYQRHAARAAEAGMDAAIGAARAGVSEREVAAEVTAAMIRAGSDEPGPGVMSSGVRAHHLHGGYSDRVLQSGDTLQFEATPNVRQYHARFMRTIKIGQATDAERHAADALIAVQERALGAVAPGVPAKEADRIYREGIAATGLAAEYTNKTFYSVGLILRPSGGEPLEATPDSSWAFQPAMTFHTYLLVDGFGCSETILVTVDGHERLTRFPRKLFVTP